MRVGIRSATGTTGAGVWGRRGAVAVAVTIGLAMGGCQGGSSDRPKPVPECEEYERALARCTGRQIPIATQPAALPTSEEQRAHLKTLCQDNLQRLVQSCGTR